MSIASIGRKIIVSGTETETGTLSWRFLKAITASLRTSSRISSFFVMPPISAPFMRVMDRRFSTMRQSHSASCLASSSSSFFCCLVSTSSPSSTVDIEPLIAVSGVRRSCDIARRRFARIFSRSDSMCSLSCALRRAVSVEVAKPTASIVMNVSG